MQQATRHRNTTWNQYPEEKVPYYMPGIMNRTATYKRMADFSLTLEPVNRRQHGNCQVNSQNTS